MTPFRPSGLVRYVFVAILILCAMYAFSSDSYGVQMPDFTSPRPAGPDPKPGESTTEHSTPSEPEKPASDKVTTSKGPHPIDELIFDSQNVFAELVSKESKTLSEAAQAYRKRRGRHPPPGFDKWFEFARGLDGMVVEDFFDQIYDDLNPFWGMDPAMLRRESWDFEMTINIRDHKASTGSDWFWTKIWLNMTKTIEDMLPDLDLPLNAMDEPRIVVPFEDVNDFMSKSLATLSLPDPKKVITEFSKLPEVGHKEPDVEPRTHSFDEKTGK